MNNFVSNKNNKYINDAEVKMLNLNQLTRSLLLSTVFTFGVGIAYSADNVNVSTQNVTTEDQQGLDILVKNIGDITQNINTTIKELEQINNIKLKNAFIVGILKNFTGDISFAELQQLSSLENIFNEKTPIEILEFTAGLISNKSNSDQTKIKIQIIKDQINDTFKINVKTTQTTSIDAMKKHPTIQKIISASKKNPDKLKKLLDHIIENTLSTSSSIKGYFGNIIKEINNLL